MDLTLLLPWFPVLLGVGVGGRLLGRRRGYALGVLCGLFWVALVHAATAGGLWRNISQLTACLAGAVAIIAIGGWAGASRASGFAGDGDGVSAGPDSDLASSDRLKTLSTVLKQFTEWLEDHREENNPWPMFDEFLRSALYQCCRATHVKPYRTEGESGRLVSLRSTEGSSVATALSLEHGRIAERVLSSGRSMTASFDDPSLRSGAVATSAKENTAWCFAIHAGTKPEGVIVVGELGVAAAENRAFFDIVEQLTGMFWRSVSEMCRNRSAMMDDPVSGVRTREAFMRLAERSLAESQAQEEPSAVAVIALERLRELYDTGQWEVADELIRSVGRALRAKVRTEDCVGRFDGSRFMLLLRRVDRDLAMLIAAQIASRLAAICGDKERWRISIGVRCGVAVSESNAAELRGLIASAVFECSRAREAGIPISLEGAATAPRQAVSAASG